MKRVESYLSLLIAVQPLLLLLTDPVNSTTCKQNQIVYGENTIVDQILTCSQHKSFDVDLTPFGEVTKSTARALVDLGVSDRTTIVYARLGGLWSARRSEFVNSAWKCTNTSITTSAVIEVSGLSLEVVEKVEIPISRNSHKISIHRPCKTFDLPLPLCRPSKIVYRTTKTWVNSAFFNITFKQRDGETRPSLNSLQMLFTCPQSFKQLVTHSPSATYILSKYLTSDALAEINHPEPEATSITTQSPSPDFKINFTKPIVRFDNLPLNEKVETTTDNKSPKVSESPKHKAENAQPPIPTKSTEAIKEPVQLTKVQEATQEARAKEVSHNSVEAPLVQVRKQAEVVQETYEKTQQSNEALQQFAKVQEQHKSLVLTEMPVVEQRLPEMSDNSQSPVNSGDTLERPANVPYAGPVTMPQVPQAKDKSVEEANKQNIEASGSQESAGEPLQALPEVNEPRQMSSESLLKPVEPVQESIDAQKPTEGAQKPGQETEGVAQQPDRSSEEVSQPVATEAQEEESGDTLQKPADVSQQPTESPRQQNESTQQPAEASQAPADVSQQPTESPQQQNETSQQPAETLQPPLGALQERVEEPKQTEAPQKPSEVSQTETAGSASETTQQPTEATDQTAEVQTSRESQQQAETAQKLSDTSSQAEAPLQPTDAAEQQQPEAAPQQPTEAPVQQSEVQEQSDKEPQQAPEATPEVAEASTQPAEVQASQVSPEKAEVLEGEQAANGEAASVESESPEEEAPGIDEGLREGGSRVRRRRSVLGELLMLSSPSHQLKYLQLQDGSSIAAPPYHAMVSVAKKQALAALQRSLGECLAYVESDLVQTSEFESFSALKYCPAGDGSSTERVQTSAVDERATNGECASEHWLKARLERYATVGEGGEPAMFESANEKRSGEPMHASQALDDPNQLLNPYARYHMPADVMINE